MQAFVYKSRRRADTYVFLAVRDDFARLPEALRVRLGELSYVLDVELAPGRRLAQSDPELVRVNLAECGFHLQLPPTGTMGAADASEPGLADE